MSRMKATTEITKFYAKAINDFAVTKKDAGLDAYRFLLTFDGEIYGTDALSETRRAQANQRVGAIHPVVELLDGLLSYVLVNWSPSLAHNAQDDCKELYAMVYELLDSHYRASDYSDKAKAELINKIRAAVWTMVKGRSSGDFYDTAWQFLARTARKDRATIFGVLTLDNVAAPTDKASIKPGFIKTLAAVRKAEKAQPGIIDAFFLWVSSLFASLFRRASTPPAPVERLPEDDANALTVDTVTAAPLSASPTAMSRPSALPTRLRTRLRTKAALDSFQRSVTPSSTYSPSLFRTKRPSAEPALVSSLVDEVSASSRRSMSA